MANEVGSWLRQSPPVPRKVGRPDATDRPAPQRARILLLVLRRSWTCSTDVLGLDAIFSSGGALQNGRFRNDAGVGVKRRKVLRLGISCQVESTFMPGGSLVSPTTAAQGIGFGDFAAVTVNRF